MVAAVGAVAVARGAHALLWTAAELADCYNQRRSSSPRSIQVGQEAGKTLVEHRAGSVAHSCGQVDVVVPRVIVGVGHLGPDHLDDLGSGFDQAPGQQAALSEGVAAVQVAGLGRLCLNLKGVACPAGDDRQRARS